MDKRNSQQKNKNKTAKKPAPPQQTAADVQDRFAGKADGAPIQGKISGPSTQKSR